MLNLLFVFAILSGIGGGVAYYEFTASIFENDGIAIRDEGGFWKDERFQHVFGTILVGIGSALPWLVMLTIVGLLSDIRSASATRSDRESDGNP